jgi:hypothetical protein
VGAGRFDDPRKKFRVLYLAARRRGAFVESLSHFRPALPLLAARQQIQHLAESLPPLVVPRKWRHQRGIGQLRVRPGQRWLDLRALATRERLRQELAPLLLELDLPDLDVAQVVGPSRVLTQAVARWAYERGAAGLVYHSRFDASLTCWALFEGAGFDAVGSPAAITADDPDLVAVARLFSLAIEPDAEQR